MINQNPDSWFSQNQPPEHGLSDETNAGIELQRFVQSFDANDPIKLLFLRKKIIDEQKNQYIAAFLPLLSQEANNQSSDSELPNLATELFVNTLIREPATFSNEQEIELRKAAVNYASERLRIMEYSEDDLEYLRRIERENFDQSLIGHNQHIKHIALLNYERNDRLLLEVLEKSLYRGDPDLIRVLADQLQVAANNKFTPKPIRALAIRVFENEIRSGNPSAKMLLDNTYISPGELTPRFKKKMPEGNVEAYILAQNAGLFLWRNYVGCVSSFSAETLESIKTRILEEDQMILIDQLADVFNKLIRDTRRDRESLNVAFAIDVMRAVLNKTQTGPLGEKIKNTAQELHNDGLI